MSANSPSEKNTANLLGELETLKDFLGTGLYPSYEETADAAFEENIPILFEIAMDNDTLEGEDIPLLMDQVDIQPESPQTNDTIPQPGDLALIKEQLQQSGEILIQEIIDEQLVQMEVALSRRLREKLKTLIEKIDH